VVAVSFRDRFQKFSHILKEQIDVLQNKVDNILKQSETEKKFFYLQKEKVYLSEVLNEIVEEFSSRAEHQGGSIELQDEALNTEIMADRYHLNGIFINLVDNALKYNSKPPRVTIKIIELTGKIYVRVKDNGHGIDKKYLRRIFMPFFRVPSGNVHNVKGSGLGLSYVKKICDLHHWKIQVVSEPGSGTEITLIIPKVR
jgi:two-component system phosphate regulon sensor histidine kinase PhoR